MTDKIGTYQKPAVQSFTALTFYGIMCGSALCRIGTSTWLAFRLRVGSAGRCRAAVVV